MKPSKKEPKYKPPRDGVVFVRSWNQLLPILKSRVNFNPAAHLRLLEILCNLFQDEQELTDTIEVVGMTYATSGRNGDFVKTRPEVAQLSKTRNQIKQYSQLLGIGLDKKSNHASAGVADAGGELEGNLEDEWS